MNPGSSSAADLGAFTCAICMDIFENPCVVSCGHTFCTRCLDQFHHLPVPLCPMCRQNIDVRNIRKDERMEHRLMTTRTPCPGCNMQLYLNQLRIHAGVCDKVKAMEKEIIDSKKITSPVVDNTNRHTFKCPYCKVAHLDQSALVRHCNENHAGSRQQVVCPVCASMPWGDPNFKSANFIQHLNARHKFEYDTYVDYQQDDDDMFKAALAASLLEK